MKYKVKNILLIIISSILLYSCFPGFDELGTKDVGVIFNYVWDEEPINIDDNLVLDNDTLQITGLKYVLSEIQLISDVDTLQKSHQLMRINNRNNSISFSNVPSNTYKLVFNFGLKNINIDYNDLNAQNLNTQNVNGYYFMKFDGIYKKGTKSFNYHIAKSKDIHYINSFEITINDFEVGSLFVNQAIINVNLKNLFKNRNQIDLDLLTPNVINDSITHTRLIENAKNIFYLNRFEYD